MRYTRRLNILQTALKEVVDLLSSVKSLTNGESN